MEDDGFKLVTKKGRGGSKGTTSRANAAVGQPPLAPLTSSSRPSGFTYKQSHKAPTTTVTAESIQIAIDEIITHMKQSTFYTSAIQEINKSVYPIGRKWKCICYGIGSITESVISRHQLAFLVLLRDEFELEDVEAYDPVFTSTDIKVLESLNISVIEKNEQGRRHVSEGPPTLFYMPHCGNQMYSNVLGSNWAKEQLSRNVVIIGNSFAGYGLMPRQKELELQSPYLTKVIPFVDEVSLTTGEYERANVFNNTAYHSFLRTESLEVNCDEGIKFWTRCDVVNECEDPEVQ
ncbi:SRR1-domain-containing protein [Obelidium mucronatum]|nr:SRR1-domain-containing protein [Obelidium mucronatum]